MSASPKITFLITDLSEGGAERQLVYLARALQERGWQVQVISMIRPETRTFTGELEHLEIPWASLDMRRGVPDVRALFRLRGLLRAQRPDVVHSHMVHANLLARLARVLTPIPVLISTAHSTNEGGRWRELAYRWTDPLCELTTNVSQASVDRYVAVGAAPKAKIRAIPNGIDSEAFAPEPESRQSLRQQLGVEAEFVWLAVGNVYPPKDYPTMLRAMARTGDGILLVAGAGQRIGEMEALALELGLAGRVRFLGPRDDVAALMNAADAYLMSSVLEGLPMVLLEASASALPIVATTVGGNAEVVRDGVSGYLVAPGDPDGLAGAMERLMAAPAEERRQMGIAGREYVKDHFDIERVVDRWVDIYDEHLRQKERPVGLASEPQR